MVEGEAKSKKDKPYGLPVAVAGAVFLILIIIYFNPGLVDRSVYGLDFDTLMNIGYLIIIVMLILQIVWKFTLSTEVEVEEPVPAKKAEPDDPKAAPKEGKPPVKKKAPVSAKPKRVVAEPPEDEEDNLMAEEPPEGLHRPHGDLIEEDIDDLPRIIEHPKKEPGGVYSDTLIRVDTSLILNLRTLLGKVCHNCEELDDCNRRIKGKLDDDIFQYNFECKDGIKRELQKARKKRQAKAVVAKDEAAKEMVKGKAAKAKTVEIPRKKAPAKKKGKKKVKKK
jgi:hypothetical protein